MEQGKQAKEVWDSVKNYAVRCSKCLKWRFIPTKEKYEEIRAKISENPFHCILAREGRPKISCEDDPDVKQDASFRWVMDRPRIPQTPSGWQRILRLRAEGGKKFADVYLNENPKYLQEGVGLSDFSFLPPVPRDEKYIAKRARTSGALSAGHSVQAEDR